MAVAHVEVLVVSVGGTIGWGYSSGELVGALRELGVNVVHVAAAAPREVRTYMLTDLVQASAARKATLLALADIRPEAVLYCSMTAALLWPRPGAVWLDATAAVNRPGRHGLWQRRLERRRLRASPMVLGCSPDALRGAPDGLGEGRRARGVAPVILPIPVSPSGPVEGRRDIDAVTYAADPSRRRLELMLQAWRAARRDGETLVVCGIEPRAPEPGVRWAGRLPAADFRGLLRRARTFLAAPRQEEYGIAPLEALADGARLVTTPAAIGAYPALAIARRLDPRLVLEPEPGADAFARAIRHALDDPDPGYARRAAAELAPYGHAAMRETLRGDVLPELLPGWRG